MNRSLSDMQKEVDTYISQFKTGYFLRLQILPA